MRKVIQRWWFCRYLRGMSFGKSLKATIFGRDFNKKESQANEIVNKIEAMFIKLQKLGYDPVAEVELDNNYALCQWGVSWKNIYISTK